MVNEVIQPAPQRQGGGGGGYTGPLAETKPHINCPAAMLCVPRWGFWLVLMLMIGHKNKDILVFHKICSIEQKITWHWFFSTKFGCSGRNWTWDLPVAKYACILYTMDSNKQYSIESRVNPYSSPTPHFCHCSPPNYFLWVCYNTLWTVSDVLVDPFWPGTQWSDLSYSVC